ncbi:MAG: DUF4783 domain-containing protein [Bacteroidota bacterium]
MKHLTIVAFLCLYSLAITASPIDSTAAKDSASAVVFDDISNSVAAAIGSGDAAKLASYFNLSIDLTVPSGDGTYSKSQAEMIVRKFFAQYPPVSFKINQQGTSNEGSQFSIGILVTTSSKFRTYFLIKKINGVPLIHQLQFEAD